MKRIVLIIASLMVLILLFGCNENNENNKVNISHNSSFCESDSDCVLKSERCEITSVNKKFFTEDYIGTPCRYNFFTGPFNAICSNNKCTKKVDCDKFCSLTRTPGEYWYYEFPKNNGCQDYETKYQDDPADIESIRGICDSLTSCSC